MKGPLCKQDFKIGWVAVLAQHIYNIITNYTETENHQFWQRERTPLQARFKIGWVAVLAQFLLNNYNFKKN